MWTSINAVPGIPAGAGARSCRVAAIAVHYTECGGPRDPTEPIVPKGVIAIGRRATAGRTGACRCATTAAVAVAATTRDSGVAVQQSTRQQQGPPSSAGHPGGAATGAAPDGVRLVATVTEAGPVPSFVLTGIARSAPCRDACAPSPCGPPWAPAAGAHSAYAAANAISSEVRRDTALLYHTGLPRRDPAASGRRRLRAVAQERHPSHLRTSCRCALHRTRVAAKCEAPAAAVARRGIWR